MDGTFLMFSEIAISTHFHYWISDWFNLYLRYHQRSNRREILLDRRTSASDGGLAWLGIIMAYIHVLGGHDDLAELSLSE
ncbi:unnamed protein product [Ceratitis capitata]|uniref:(Mediterranean fruit fly) hypothetical protein n=1 Tax=Ceratitis capitata TaxID=7213 RepID=A0A811TYW4_CERCA|nr:unnamed protein product [Ceratitis capitata]